LLSPPLRIEDEEKPKADDNEIHNDGDDTHRLAPKKNPAIGAGLKFIGTRKLVPQETKSLGSTSQSKTTATAG
jgi:hypothetical protein